MVSGVLFLRTWLRKVSCRFCARSDAILVVPEVIVPCFWPRGGPFPRGLRYKSRFQFRPCPTPSWPSFDLAGRQDPGQPDRHTPGDPHITGHPREGRKHKLGATTSDRQQIAPLTSVRRDDGSPHAG